MGKGDRKTKKGKRFIGSYGNTRKHKSSLFAIKNKPTTKKKAVTKKSTKKTSSSKEG